MHNTRFGAGRRGRARRSMPTSRLARQAMVRVLSDPRFEILPTAGVADLVTEHLPQGRTVTVTASPTKGLEATLALAEQLSALGYHAVPHLAARMVTDAAELSEIVARLRAAGVDEVFIPSGDATESGAYPDAFSLLHALDGLGRPFPETGITAYPESHPTIPDDMTIQAMWDKREHATKMVSNMTFDPQIVQTWLTRVRRRGVTLPLWLGIPAPISTAQLLRVASRIGVGDSTRFLTKNPHTILRLARPAGFSSESFLRRLGPALAQEESRVEGLHVYTFNHVAEAETWRTELLDRLRKEHRHHP